MATTINAADVTQQIQKLLEERGSHEVAIGAIDATLAKIQQLLSGTPKVQQGARLTATVGGRRRGRPQKALQGPGPQRSRRKRRGSFTVTGEESVLQFVKSHGQPTTQDINEHWTKEGRGGSANNALTKLAKEKKLKRVPVKDGRGSRYQIG